uniref:Uncharacterized protein n=1 Tax=Rhizochromulina marina TaxID=1034831 RepID=A0A7S2WCQ1_9STRA|mmetsp:Transcript_21278/g.62100  ORF Transcript_21278/g.62100 Transcript_21278/m.62100 type:complete len:214 (+) Transcript_21278:16-657(+)|eukprot:CAMPEP_0118964642 /NCGR_PEP_ID=MMETSP1173-20130426/2301_1 /TAXON_ID=1034831 /ORGANISM="Rhizochromulina marina cf, Strain CCMP1243" /LENGTH=213 /DNA_ID=CAMNT_0006913123 /DNA_START=13 /DNA_END=654 /DNA_ORIENTATION=-
MARLRGLLVLLLSPALAFRAGAPVDLPADWCREEQGTRTASTGECMCRESCEGANCETGQGLVWYSYKRCPSGCACVASPPSDGDSRDLGSVFGGDPAVESCQEDKPCEDGEDEEAQGDAYLPPLDLEQQEEEEPLLELLFEWIDDNGRLVFGVGAVAVFLVLLAPVFAGVSSVITSPPAAASERRQSTTGSAQKDRDGERDKDGGGSATGDR